jgi:hypothetical protein
MHVYKHWMSIYCIFKNWSVLIIIIRRWVWTFNENHQNSSLPRINFQPDEKKINLIPEYGHEILPVVNTEKMTLHNADRKYWKFIYRILCTAFAPWMNGIVEGALPWDK